MRGLETIIITHHLGMVGTEQIYFATSHLKVDGGIEITASHNPIDFNGMKLVRHGSRPISSDSGLLDIKRLAEDNQFLASEAQGTYRELDLTEAYVDHLLGYIDHAKISPIKLVVNAGNGSAGPVVDAFEERFKKNGLPIEFIKIFNRPDGTFPNGIPNPSLHENRGPTVDAVIEYGADMGIAWDGDFDRCFLFDEKEQVFRTSREKNLYFVKSTNFSSHYFRAVHDSSVQLRRM